MKKITILTRQVSIKASLRKLARNILRFFLKFLKTGVLDFDIFIYYGHTAVTKSLIYGLKELGVNFNYNPFFIKDVGDTVVVLSDPQAVNQAVNLKRQGKIKKLLAGPNIIEITTKYDKILSQKEIDLVIVSSNMTKEIYERTNSKLIGKIAIWYAGVDTSYWKSNQSIRQKNVLVYWKNATTAFSKEVELSLERNGYNVKRVIYGHYSKKRFKKLLQKSVFSVFLSITETQGIALVESWSMDVPTIVWNPEIEHYYLRGIQTTSAPYLTSQTGIKWRELDDLEELLKEKDFYKKGFSPRKWVMENMSNKCSAEMLIKICKSINNN